MADKKEENTKGNAIKLATAVVGLISAILTMSWAIDSHVTGVVTEQTKKVAELFADDLRTRIMIQDLRINDLKERHQKIPQSMTINKELLENQLKKLNEKWKD